MVADLLGALTVCVFEQQTHTNSGLKYPSDSSYRGRLITIGLSSHLGIHLNFENTIIGIFFIIKNVRKENSFNIFEAKQVT